MTEDHSCVEIGMKKVIVGSLNPAKLEAVRLGFAQMFPSGSFMFESIKAPSGVSDQPQNSDETLLGAKNRAYFAKKNRPDADFWIGLEGGIERKKNEMEVFAWIVILDKNSEGKSRTAHFFLPRKVIQLIDAGYELGEADDIIFKKINSKQKGGSVGLLTENAITRTSYYSQAVVLALIIFKNKALYTSS